MFLLKYAPHERPNIQLQLEREAKVLDDIAQKIQQAFREVKPESPAGDDPAVVVDEVHDCPGRFPSPC